MTQRASTFVNESRLAGRIDAMARLGATTAGGVNRQALSEADAQAQELMVSWGRELDLQPSRDEAGNFFLHWPGQRPGAAVMTGSHMDSQPTGGRYDGIYGVLAGLEAIHAMKEAGMQPQRSIDIVAWMNEEGSRFAPGMMGSSVYAGARALDETLAVVDAQGVSVAQALQCMARRLPDIPMRALGAPVHAYLEAHIEQGPVLQREGDTVGIVTGIQGKHTYRITVSGEAAHAGTSERGERKDALMTACAMVHALGLALHDDEDVVKFTVGRFDVTPNAPSVVASRVVFSIDLRHPDTDRLRALSDQVDAVCQQHKGPCAVQVDCLSAADSLQFPEPMRNQLRAAAKALDIKHRDLPSAAGHDARYMHDICPSAMLFIPCRDGITHNEAEYAAPADMAAGARVLADTLANLTLGDPQ